MRTVLVMRRALLTLALVATVLTVVVGVTKVTDTPQPSRALASCVNEEDGQTRQDCLTAVLRSAVADKTFRSLEAELSRLSDTVDGFRGVCHIATHQLGRLALSSHSSPETLIEDTSPRVCGDGLAHAVMEAHALRGATTAADWVDLVEACGRYLSAGSSRGDGCSHGFGHGMYLATVDQGGVTASLKLCREVINTVSAAFENSSAMRDLLGTGCGYGVLMGAYAPVTGPRTVIESPDQLLFDCASLLVVNPDAQDPLYLGCMSGVGFSYGVDLMIRSLPGTEATTEAISRCMGSTTYRYGAGESRCADQVFQHAAEFLLMHSPEQGPTTVDRVARYHELCQDLSVRFGEEMQVSCLAQSKNTITDAVFEDIRDYDPKLRDRVDMLASQFGS